MVKKGRIAKFMARKAGFHARMGKIGLRMGENTTRIGIVRRVMRPDFTGFGVPEHHGDCSALRCSSKAAISASKSGHRVDVGLEEEQRADDKISYYRR
jgi:hypothetical protein